MGSYEYFKFVVQWPPAHCRVRKCTPQALQQKIYTIHGLWPSNYSKAVVYNCPGSSFQNPAPPLEAKLKISWPNLERPNDAMFWALEWDRHGKCSEQTFTQTQYFNRAHEIWVGKNITDILQRASILSGRQKDYGVIELAVRSKTQKTPLLRCEQPKQKPTQKPTQPTQRTQWLHEVVLCWDYHAKNMIDCDDTEATCQDTFPIDIL
ncbi:putative ribonuclease T(2) [Rosa chinensis]|uniref:Putative ribonuclease T(2) n=1 Tax=Rosa chinensis TaxID=74649 RepID=A0A2P6R778_ROSCH|nr:putative ribonuclease T(2) [Rosa chinensis]